ncbi:unnamed protein product [Caenorhabditis angaria]|uniref:Hyccin n=1 Tax=Caenorhabditis angaria TaxID=860376 RepID=A0A9P1MZG9_9PELO|nr:unnamed protein product [Caenorhabditis angaria]
MNSEQISEFLLDLERTVGTSFSQPKPQEQQQPSNGNEKKEDLELFRKFLTKSAPNTLYVINYINSNYTDIDLVQSIIGQILSLYYKGGILRLYALQYVPGFIALYLLALSKKQQKSATLFETFFVAVYNEEIVVDPNSDVKKVEEVRIPSIRYPSIYHDPSKMQSHSEVSTIRPGSIASVLTTVRIGPFPTYPLITASNKFVVLSRILKSINQSLFVVSSEVVSRHICLATLSICRSGFSFPDTGFNNKVLENEQSQEVIEDFTRKPRQHVASNLLLEFLTGSYLALFNGCADLALRAIDSIHLRAQYEMLPEVLLVVNSIRNSLLDNPLSKEKRGELMWTRQYKEKRKDMVTNASLRMKRMPEDIPVQEQIKEKEHSKLGELMEEGMDHLHDLKKKVVGIGLHHKIHRRRKSVEHEETELQPIKEEKPLGAEFSSSEVESTAEKDIVLNSDDLERRLRDATIVEHDYQKELVAKGIVRNSQEEGEHDGSFTIAGLRHMDSDEFTAYR